MRLFFVVRKLGKKPSQARGREGDADKTISC